MNETTNKQTGTALAGSDSSELLPCPFCGSDDVKYKFSWSQGYVECNSCGALGPDDPMAADPYCNIDAAKSAWNKRAG